MSNLLYILIMAPASENQSPFMTLLPLILIVLVFYFFMIRPQMKKQKDLRTFRESIKKGDRIVTTGGIYGKIVDTKENIIVVDVGDNIRLKIDKSAILKDPSDLATQK
jgi:preprotein translocase subunit YajC